MRIVIGKNWDYGGPQSRGSAMLYAGEYRVPQDISKALAERAISEHAAHIVFLEESDVPDTFHASVTVEGLPKSAQKKQKRKKKRRVKSLGAAPENK